MARLRFLTVALLALALAGSPTQMGKTQTPTTSSPTYLTTSQRDSNSIGGLTAVKPVAEDQSCVIYSLTDMGYDAELGTWIAQTMPDMIEPQSWQPQGGSGVLRYYAPKNVLIVKQSKSIQSKVEGFLKDLKTSMPKASAANHTGKKAAVGVVPAEYREPALLRTSGPVSEAQPYPVPAAVKQPKHLFHFIIRYEGEGIVDDNVVKFLKAYAQSEKAAVTAPAGAYAPAAAPPTVCAPAPTPPGAGYTSPAIAEGTPAPAAVAPEAPSKSPKKKKGKKDAHEAKPATVTSGLYSR